jgi:hypothetical protein
VLQHAAVPHLAQAAGAGAALLDQPAQDHPGITVARLTRRGREGVRDQAAGQLEATAARELAGLVQHLAQLRDRGRAAAVGTPHRLPRGETVAATAEAAEAAEAARHHSNTSLAGEQALPASFTFAINLNE